MSGIRVKIESMYIPAGSSGGSGRNGPSTSGDDFFTSTTLPDSNVCALHSILIRGGKYSEMVERSGFRNEGLPCHRMCECNGRVV